MATIDWIALVFVLVLAFGGARKGLLAGGLSLVGVVGGLYLGGRLAPVILSGSSSPYTPLVALAGALLLAIALETVGALAGGVLRDSVRLTPLRLLDSAGGLVLGGATAVAVLWLVAAIAFQMPQASSLRAQARESVFLPRLVEALPPQEVMNALAGIDPFPLITGPAAPSQPPDEGVLAKPALARAQQSVVKVHSQACGIRYAGSGWVTADGLVVTAAHVVAGAREVDVRALGDSARDARVVAFDGHNDLALLSVPGLPAEPLRLAPARSGDTVAVLGFPNDGPFRAIPARMGQTATLFSPDYSGRIVSRTITSLRGKVRPGDSGGPVVNGRGVVELTVFGARKGTDVGYGTSTELIAGLRAKAVSSGVSTGACLN